MKGGAGVGHEGRLHDRPISIQCPKAHGVLSDFQPLNADAAFMSQGILTTICLLPRSGSSGAAFGTLLT